MAAASLRQHGSIAENLLGLIHGVGGNPEDWLQQFEVRDVIERIGQDPWPEDPMILLPMRPHAEVTAVRAG